jgi:glycosyltransferase involved in cell wall biosynthesis
MFSVVIPLWNKRSTIAETVASVLAQDFADFELIVVDDGSTDGGAEALAGLDDPRLVLVRQANAGPGAARNAGIAAASGAWIAFLDADDIWLPGHLAELDRIRRAFPDAGLIGTAYRELDRAGRVHGPMRAAEAGIGAIDYLDEMGRGRAPFTTSSAAIPFATFRALGGFGPAPAGQDIEYWARIALDRPVAASTRVTSIYRLGTGGISNTVRSLWYGRELGALSDLDPAVALMVSRYPGLAPERRAAADRFLEARLQQCIRYSARIGDFPTLRALRRLGIRPALRSDRLILACAALPALLARAAYWAGFRLKALRRGLRAPGSGAGDRLGRAGG